MLVEIRLQSPGTRREDAGQLPRASVQRTFQVGSGVAGGQKDAQIGLQFGANREIAAQGLDKGGVKGATLVHRLLVEHALVQKSVVPQNPETESMDCRDGGPIQCQQSVAQPGARRLVNQPAFLVGQPGSIGTVGRKMAKLAQLLAQSQAKLGSGAFSEGDDQDLLDARAVIEQQLDHQVLE